MQCTDWITEIIFDRSSWMRVGQHTIRYDETDESFNQNCCFDMLNVLARCLYGTLYVSGFAKCVFPFYLAFVKFNSKVGGCQLLKVKCLSKVEFWQL